MHILPFYNFKIQILTVLSVLLLPLVTHAQIKYTLTNHLNGITSIEGLALAILEIFITVATPIIILFIIYAGFLYVTAKGDATKVGKATKALTYAIIGAIMILGATVFAEIMKTTIASFGP